MKNRLVPGFPPRPSKDERGGVPLVHDKSHKKTLFGVPAGQRSGRGFREDWPFLKEPSCPPELKILVSNKINAYQEYCEAHSKLFDCTNPDEQYNTVKQVVENFIENRKIFDELDHYKKHGHTLGIHPIFKEYQEIRELRSLSDVELYQRKKRLQHNIWRIESQLRSADSPPSRGDADRQGGILRLQREQSLIHKQNLLIEVDRILSSRLSGMERGRA